MLSRLAQHAKLLRVGCGIYAIPVASGFGTHASSAAKKVEGLATKRGEASVPQGTAAATAPGLTTREPTRASYLRSAPNRRLKLGAQAVGSVCPSRSYKPKKALRLRAHLDRDSPWPSPRCNFQYLRPRVNFPLSSVTYRRRSTTGNMFPLASGWKFCRLRKTQSSSFPLVT